MTELYQADALKNCTDLLTQLTLFLPFIGCIPT
jgi:hypothetical protein